MKTAQYVSIERNIIASETGSIWQRWLYGLRLLRDPEAIAQGGGLKHGVTDQLIAAAKNRGIKLSPREIQYRIQCARTYPTESQMRNAVADFEAWRDLISAGFPPYPAEADDEPADARTPAERRRDLARHLAEIGLDQEALFPLDVFEPTQATLKDLCDYRDRQQRITEGFIATGNRRSQYLEALSVAVGHDLSQTWRDAHLAAFGTNDIEDL